MWAFFFSFIRKEIAHENGFFVDKIDNFECLFMYFFWCALNMCKIKFSSCYTELQFVCLSRRCELRSFLWIKRILVCQSIHHSVDDYDIHYVVISIHIDRYTVDSANYPISLRETIDLKEFQTEYNSNTTHNCLAILFFRHSKWKYSTRSHRMWATENDNATCDFRIFLGNWKATATPKITTTKRTHYFVRFVCVHIWRFFFFLFCLHTSALSSISLCHTIGR